ncbi:MAG: glucose 1-dehydrogenase [Spirochaetales bacterium]|nr:glucose 1-dehydrogenase [Spirochaetales bacterium]
METKSLAGKTAVVTGAASGIGRSIALLFAAEGAQVIVADITTKVKEGGEPTADCIQQAGGSALFIPTDVSKWTEVDNLVSQTVERFGRLDIMVNNAAIAVDKPLVETTEEDWNRVMDINAKGVFFCCKRAVQQMLTQEIRNEARGRIINISSQHGMICAPGNFAYGVGKSTVVYMTRQIAVDYAKEHIICNALAPGRILTGKPLISSDSVEYSQSRTPFPRLGVPSDVAKAALFLAGDGATYITGVNLLVDGGWMAG